MKVGLIPVNVGVKSVETMVEIAAHGGDASASSRCGPSSTRSSPIDYASKYPYSGDGKMGVTPETNFVDPLIALAAIAANTERVRLATGVNILPQTNPLLLAKQAASLDFVSNGRFMLGVGIGWLRGGVRRDGRSVRAPRRALRRLRSRPCARCGPATSSRTRASSCTGRASRATRLPSRRPFPVIIGGSKGKAFERIARYGDGWYAPTANLKQLAALLPQLDNACAAVGRERGSVEITAMWIPALEGVDVVPRYEELGVDRLVIPLPALAAGGGAVAGIRRCADEVLAKLG